MPDHTFRYADERLPGGGLTYDEWHAALLGLIGILAGAGWYFGARGPVGAFSIAVFTLALGLRAAPEDLPVGGRLIRHEPWYFTTVYIVSATIAYWYLVVFR